MKSSLRVLVLSLAAGGVGCAGSELLHHSSDTVDVRSQPPGATVVVMGKELGATPLGIPVSAIFPVTYPANLTPAYGRIRVLKQGCEPFETTVSSHVMNRGLDAHLKCNAAPAGKPPVTVEPAMPNTGGTAPDSGGVRAAPAPSSNPGSQAVERLRAIETLRRERLIDENEYRRLRARVLDGL